MIETGKIIPLLRTGDIILFYTPFKWYKIRTYLSALIRFFASTKYNHAGVVVSSWAKPMLNEAQAVGMITEPCESRLKGCYVKILRRPDIRLRPEEYYAMRANGVLGNTKYDFSGTLFHQLVLNIWFWITGARIWLGKTGKEAARRMYCYEFAAWVHSDIFPEWWKVNVSEMAYHSRFEDVYEGKII